MPWKRTPEFLVELRWLNPDEGGRVCGPPALSFEPDSEYRGIWVESESAAWSVIVHRAEPPAPSNLYEAVRPFEANGAPTWKVGQELILSEGRKRVAIGRVARVL